MRALKDKAYDFSATYMAVCDLQTLSQTNPEVINSEVIPALESVLKDPEFFYQTQAYFLYKEVTNTLCSIIIHSRNLADQAFSALKNLLAVTSGHSHRAAAEALAALPFSIHGPEINKNVKQDIPCVRWRQIWEGMGLTISHPPRLFGRSLIAEVEQGDRLLVIKLARAGEPFRSLYGESLWMEHLRTRPYRFPVRFDIPAVIRIEGNYAFRLMDMPIMIPHNTAALHPAGYAIGFIADKDYYSYPNGTGKERILTNEKFKEVIFRNAWLLGRLTSFGIVHSAPIPLFHNRVQRRRRRDHGLYEWPRAGRLDAWLKSCFYPNLGLTGIRDFEHFISFKGPSRNLYRYIGIHIFSLLLVSGSYFRNKDGSRIGFDKYGRPVDTRDLFDKQYLEELIRGIFLSYYSGFVTDEFKGRFPFDLSRLASRMIEEMGVDRHMEEILRVADQKEMTDEEFRYYLVTGGYLDEEINTFRKGIEDIVIYRGPHLGEFNHRISLPELIESVGTMSALCIAGRYWRETRQAVSLA